MSKSLNIAVVGSGISGLSCAWLLSQRHNVTVYEADSRIGGHSNTVEVIDSTGQTLAIDTGFIVHNPGTYPNFVALMDYLDVETVSSDMSFSVFEDRGSLQYSGSSIRHVLGPFHQWLDFRHLRMVFDLVRFYKRAHRDGIGSTLTLGEYLARHGYSQRFLNAHIYPIAAAIWSSDADQMAQYPLAAFTRFFHNHRLFELGSRPVWRTIKGGARNYVDKLLDDSKVICLLNNPVESVAVGADGRVLLTHAAGKSVYDRVIIAAHADQALQMLANPTTRQIEILSKLKTSENTATLHRDKTVMPRSKRYWSSWNYQICTANSTVSYWMNSLQKLGSRDDYFVTLNGDAGIDPKMVERRFIYSHPIFDHDAMEAQSKIWDIQGQNNIWYAGAWMGSGFHEDGLQAGLAVAEQIGGVRRPWVVADESGRIAAPPHLRNPMLNLASAD